MGSTNLCAEPCLWTSPFGNSTYASAKCHVRLVYIHTPHQQQQQQQHQYHKQLHNHLLNPLSSLFGPDPMTTVCPNCRAQIITCEENHHPWWCHPVDNDDIIMIMTFKVDGDDSQVQMIIYWWQWPNVKLTQSLVLVNDYSLLKLSSLHIEVN